MSIYRSDAARDAVEEGYRALLDRWPVPATRTTLPTRHGDTFVLACGPDDAPPAVLLHGAGFNSAAWCRCWSSRVRRTACSTRATPPGGSGD